MNTNDKTLADVQPGGRVRLGDQAERARWRSMDTCPRDGTVVRLRWGEDHVSPGWWSAPVSPVQNDDGTWPSDTGGFPWAFIDFNNGSAFVNHAVDTEYGPTHWAPYAALSAQPSPGGQDARAIIEEFIQCATLGRPHGKLIAQAKDYLAARQPVGEPVAYWLAVDKDDIVEFGMSADDGNEGQAARQEVNDFINWALHDGGVPHRLVGVYTAPPAQAVDLGTGIKAIASERERQLCMEGFSRDSDEQYREGELARAATAYVQLAAMDLQVGSRKHIASQEPPFFWPWAPEWWKPVDARHDLVRAGALIAAQIDLIDSQAVGK